MKTATLAGLFLCVLILVGLLSDLRPASAHYEDFNVQRETADDVVAATGEMREATLKKFMLHAKEHIKSLDFVTASRFRREMRREGPWKSGSIYLIVMDPKDGQVFIHGNDREAEERRLFSLPSDTEGIDIASLKRISAAAVAADGREICLKYDDSGTQKWSCAVTYFSSLDFGKRLLLVAGYHHDKLPARTFAQLPGSDYKPSVTASEVHDRETLKKFVEEAIEAYKVFSTRHCVDPSDPTTCDLSKTSLYRPVMRSAEGPWKSDQNAVYLFMMYDEGERVIFNGNNKSLEGASLLVTDANGVHLGPTIIKEAKEPGEDGFFLYLWDDPRTKEDDIYDPGGAPGISPKLGYVKALDLPKSGRVIIFGSGIYPKVEKVEKGCAVAAGTVSASESAVFNLLLIVSAVFLAVLRRNRLRSKRT